MARLAASGAGTKRVRKALGSERIMASTFSSKQAGHQPLQRLVFDLIQRLQRHGRP